MKNYYAILEVLCSASVEEIRKEYLRLALKYHPDRNPGNPEAEAKFKEINEAHRILSDPQAKAQYDAERSNYSANPHQTDTNFDFPSFDDLLRDNVELRKKKLSLEEEIKKIKEEQYKIGIKASIGAEFIRWGLFVDGRELDASLWFPYGGQWGLYEKINSLPINEVKVFQEKVFAEIKKKGEELKAKEQSEKQKFSGYEANREELRERIDKEKKKMDEKISKMVGKISEINQSSSEENHINVKKSMEKLENELTAIKNNQRERKYENLSESELYPGDVFFGNFNSDFPKPEKFTIKWIRDYLKKWGVEVKELEFENRNFEEEINNVSSVEEELSIKNRVEADAYNKSKKKQKYPSNSGNNTKNKQNYWILPVIIGVVLALTLTGFIIAKKRKKKS